MWRNRISIAALFLLLGTVLAAQKTNQPSLNSSPEEEFNLAKTPSFYFLIDLGAKKVDLKARGFVLREWQVLSARVWGKRVPLGSIRLLRKTSLFAPQRKKIVPGSAESTEPFNPKPKPESKAGQIKKKEEATFELQALELKDMPKTYRLQLEGAIGIEIRSKQKGFSKSLQRAWDSLRWYTFYPLRTLWSSLKKRSFTEIEIMLENEQEAEALYWVLLEGQRAIIRATPSS
jgi:hypothetical protein